MSDKSDLEAGRSAAEFFALPDQHVLALTGPDAVAFAQALAMNDVAALSDGHWHWNGWLTPKGRIVALFALLRLDAETVWLLLPDADPDTIALRLRKFVFRSKLSISVRTELHVSGAFRPPAAASGARFAAGVDGSIELDLGGDGGARVLRIAPGDAPPQDGAALARWRAFDFQHGLPRLDASQAEHWTPQQLSLQRLGAFSVKKGCYPGQEIVARTHFLGQAKRGLALLRTAVPAAPGDEVRHADAAVGSIVATEAGLPQPLALAVLPLDQQRDGLQVGGEPAVETALRDGLAR